MKPQSTLPHPPEPRHCPPNLLRQRQLPQSLMMKQLRKARISRARQDRREIRVMADAVMVVHEATEDIGDESEEDRDAIGEEEVGGVVGAKGLRR